MASYTSNYGLHQWEPGDDFLRTDFNADFQKIDTAIAGRGDCRICNGSYVGTGTSRKENPNTITTGFPPHLVIVSGDEYHVVFVRADTRSVAYTDNTSDLQIVSWLEDGVSWYTESATSDPYEQLNKLGTVYSYVAVG